MNGSRVSHQELISLVYGYFGRKASTRVVDSVKQTVSCVLYESFEFECVLDNEYGTFGAAVLAGANLSTIKFLGQKASLNPDPDSIRASLELVERWCRLRLPDKFLEEYDRRVLAP